MRLCLHQRTAHRVHYHLASVAAADADGLYQGLRRLPWENVLMASGPHAYLTVTTTTDNKTNRDSRFANLKAKDAICDRMVERCRLRPDSGPERNRAVVHLFWKGETADLYVDAAGEPLSRRGYRKIPLAAPMQESLAAAVILATAWNGRTPFVNPMCGSGTLAIEAALMAAGRAPGLLRSNFGLMHLQGFAPTAWRQARQGAREGERETAAQVIATDLDPRAVAGARQNARTAGVEDRISFAACPFAQTEVPSRPGVVVLNPPYGERTGDEEQLVALYGEIGDFFKQRCGGYRGYVFTGNLTLAKKVGLKARRRIPFFNGDLECRLLEYELYAGTRRTDRQTRGQV
jgi:putative N6-adenine-specific DNA methylase